MELKNIMVKSPQEYPKIEEPKRSPKTVAILKNLMCGSHGELPSVLQYFYQSSVSHKIEEELSNLLEEISIIEMHHMGLLSHAIVCFGGEPRYEYGQGQIFNASQINCSTKLATMLEANLKAEEMAIRNYKEAIEIVDNASLKKLFARIIMDEELHIKALTEIRDKVKFMSI